MRLAFPILICSVLLAACGSHPGNNEPSTASTPMASATAASAAASTAQAQAPASTAAPASSPATTTTSPSDSAKAGTDDTNASNGGQDSAITPAELAQARTIYQRGAGKWTEGTNYYRITPPQPKAGSTSKVEVLEVFSWGCPACNAAHAAVDSMRKALPSFATMDYLPASFIPTENWPLYQRVFFTAKAMGLARKSYDAMFTAVWDSGELATYNLAGRGLKPRSEWPTIDDVARFYAKKYGVNAKQFAAVASSFSVNMQMKRADDLIKAYGVNSTPTFVVNGMYRFSYRSAGGVAQGTELAQWLAAKAALGK